MKNIQTKTITCIGIALSMLLSCKKQDLQSTNESPTITSAEVQAEATTPVSAVFGGGPFYSGGTAVMNTLKSSGFTTVILWSIHLRSNGDLWLNDKLIVSNGAYVGDSTWPSQLATLKQAPTSVTRIEASVGSAGVNDFQYIKDLIAAQGTDSSSILFRNFLALKNATGADCIDLDDEILYDVNTTVQFNLMCARIGMHVSLCPYTNSTFWNNVLTQTNSQMPGTIDAVYLQCYAGGASNSPSSWSAALGGFPVYPGLWCRHGTSCAYGDNPAAVQTKMTNWRNSAGITGGFMWLFDDMQKCASVGTAAQYANAINTAVTAPRDTTSGVIFYQNTNYGGTASQKLAKGNYTRAQLLAKGVSDNWASSVKVPTGWKVIMYDKDNFSTTYSSWSRTSNTPYFTSLSPSANDRMTSCRIQ